jgi:hypothetical protein
MYYIINKTRKESYTHQGNFPYGFLKKMLEEGDNLIVISSYSNTIKVPMKDEYDDWVFQDFEYHQETLKDMTV